MRKTLLILLVLIAFGVGAAFYRGWFGVSGSHDSETGRIALTFVIDSNKIQADFQRAKEKVGGGASNTGQKPTDQ